MFGGCCCSDDGDNCVRSVMLFTAESQEEYQQEEQLQPRQQQLQECLGQMDQEVLGLTHRPTVEIGSEPDQ